MIYVTGDTHGDLKRFQGKEIAKQLKKGDTLIVCGDFGFFWDNSRPEQRARKWLAKQKYTILFVEGTHDNLEILEDAPEEDWCGGKVRRLGGNILQLCRGHVFKIEGSFIFAEGGGESMDMESRELHGAWWERELPTPQELEEARVRLAEYRNVVDYIVTHDGPATLRKNVRPGDETLHVSHLNLFFDEVSRDCRFKQWFFGCYHVDKKLSPNHTAVFQSVIPLGAARI